MAHFLAQSGLHPRDTWFRQCLVEKVDELEDELTGKKQKVADGKVFAQNLVKKIDWLLSKTLDNLHLLRENIEDKELLMSKLECLEDKVGKTTTGASEEES